ncbi:MAG: histidine ammonia-lyase [Gemmatimonadota bacterium]|jgi:histidine ammonia-lyase|nr:histidine ammonia-lyase [Gemmatimonadota bacterium]MDP6529926.1 histidine ammonia-lyase [Gemmatimonadota bacterium]MDP6802963.1 histidine ammonia-lyase [Gemmatimonadota bacterium]MDP7032719.1 histidine ammonia-lyase [Gemmatimonadota bacterium]
MVSLDGRNLTLADVVSVARERTPASVSDDAMDAVARARAFLEERVASGQIIYGVNTGIGHLAEVAIDAHKLEDLQRNIVRSHAAGTGPALAADEVRAVLLLKINLFAKGLSGVRPELVRLLQGMLREDVLPVVPAKGSLGASGDLAPLAHVALAVQGEGEVDHDGRTLPAVEGLREAGLEPLTLSFKEGLGLINGCQVMAGRGTLLLHDARILLRTAQAVSGMILEVFGASSEPFDERVHDARPYPGQRAVAANLRTLRTGGESGGRVQEAYSLRCVPQILGGVADAFDDLDRRLAVEVNAASDNPLVFAESREIIAAGNFHGESLGLALDHFGTALAEIASLAERQMNRLLNPALSGLPAFLAPATGLNSGLMILHYTAASLVSENKVLCHPACADSIPVSADQEDHVSMGGVSVHKAGGILENTAVVVGAAAMAACQAVDLVRGGSFGDATVALRKCMRGAVPFWEEDRHAATDLRAASRLALAGDLLGAVEAVTGTLE